MQNLKLRIGILSTASISHKLYQAIQVSQNCQAYAVASRSLAKAQEWAKDHEVAKVYGSYDELLNDPNVDAVYIPLPTSLKKEWAIKAANLKKHVLVEKPLPGADSTKDLEEMLQACKLNQVTFMDCTMWLHTLKAYDIVQRKKAIGNVRIVNAAVTFRSPSEEWLEGNNIRTNNTLEPQGCLGDLGWYCIGAILLAYDYEMPTKVRSVYCLKNSSGAIIQQSGFLEYTGGRIGYFDCGFNSPHRGSLEIVGETGVIRLDNFSGGFGRTGDVSAYFNNFVGHDQYCMDDLNGKEQIINVEPSNSAQLMVDQFANLAMAKDDLGLWSVKSLKTHKILAALYQSQHQGGININIE